MADDQVFNHLISEISLDERNKLLNRLSAQSNISTDPLYEDRREPKRLPAGEAFKKLPWYHHLLCFLISIFTDMSPQQVFENRQLAKLGKEIEDSAPGIFDYKRNLLLPGFHHTLTELKNGARFFYTALDSSLNHDKGGFYAFLASLELGDIHQRLLADTDPRVIVDKNPYSSELELQQIAFRDMEDIISSTSETQRNVMYKNARSLFCLKELACFLYDRVLLTFTNDPLEGGMTAPANVMREQLGVLNNILYSFKDPPGMSLIESMFVFMLKEQSASGRFDPELEVRGLLSKAADSLATIRVFNRQIPLTRILRCAAKDLALEPTNISGGEDWYILFRDYWQDYVDQSFTGYIRERRHRELLAAFRYFFKDEGLRPLENAQSDANPEGIPIRGSFGLSFLLTFYRLVFLGDVNMLLRIILLDGDFYNRETRTTFTEFYNSLIKMEDEIEAFDANLSPSGKYGKRYAEGSADTSLQANRRRMQLAMEDAIEEAQALLVKSRAAMEGVLGILEAIIKKNHEGDYDMLANMAKLLKGNQGKDKAVPFLNSILDTIQKLQKAVQILNDIDVMEFDG